MLFALQRYEFFSKSQQDVIEFATECYAFEENLTIEKVYNDCKEIADTY